jgi:fermentation-respiration switch protein FrsA (DUF1100 family)
MNRLAILALIVALGYAGWVVILYATQRHLLYLPDTSSPNPTAFGVAEMSVVQLVTEDGLSLRAWYRAACGESATIIYLHGNGGHLGYRADRVRPYLDAGYGVLLVGYRGYGANPGRPSEAGLYSDARAAMTFLAGQGVSADRVVLYGESLGSAVAVQLAMEQAQAGHPVRAVVLETPLSSMVEVAGYHYPYVPVRWLLTDRFDSLAKIAAIAAPLFLAHGDRDRVVPQRFGSALFATAVEPKEALWIDGAGHEDLGRFGLAQSVLNFLRRHADNRPSQACPDAAR